MERHLYRVKLDGSGRSRVTQAPGTHAISMAPRSEYYLDTYSNLTSPPARTLFKADGSQWATFVEADRRPLEEYDIRPTEIVEVRAADNTVLYARLIRPAGFRAGVKYPAVVFVYGGPHAQQVRNRWAGLTLEQALAHRGFVVWELDNRGSGGRGHLWESALYRGFGAKELEDQQAGVRRLDLDGLRRFRPHRDVRVELRRLHDPLFVAECAGLVPRRRGRSAGRRLEELRHHLHREVLGPALGERGSLPPQFTRQRRQEPQSRSC